MNRPRRGSHIIDRLHIRPPTGSYIRFVSYTRVTVDVPRLPHPGLPYRAPTALRGGVKRGIYRHPRMRVTEGGAILSWGFAPLNRHAIISRPAYRGSPPHPGPPYLAPTALTAGRIFFAHIRGAVPGGTHEGTAPRERRRSLKTLHEAQRNVGTRTTHLKKEPRRGDCKKKTLSL